MVTLCCPLHFVFVRPTLSKKKFWRENSKTFATKLKQSNTFVFLMYHDHILHFLHLHQSIHDMSSFVSLDTCSTLSWMGTTTFALKLPRVDIILNVFQHRKEKKNAPSPQ